MIDATATPVKLLNWDTYEYNESEREYLEVSQVRGTISKDRGYGYPTNETIDVTLYLDPETGLVVYDVAAYEKWIGA